jgi:hypothetical protein
MSASWQPHRELGEVTGFAVDRDGAAVLLRYYLVADRQPKPGALAGRLGREERLEQLPPGAIKALEETLSRPVLTANQVAFWQALMLSKAKVSIVNYGRIFAVAPPASR